MSFMIAAAGTGGHVYPGLAVAEALVSSGVDRSAVICVGGDRVESTVYPAAGFEFIELELRGLKRSLSPSNLSLPRVVLRARSVLARVIGERSVGSALGMGGYVTIPLALAARQTGVPLHIAEQNAGAGLANRISARWARRVFTSFPRTEGLPRGEWVGNPVRAALASFDRESLRAEALDRYGFDPAVPVLGVFGGSLGAVAINDAVAAMLAEWRAGPIQVVHLVGRSNDGSLSDAPHPPEVEWARVAFEDRMDLFYAAVDLVIARAGGSVAEVTATATPSILVPGDFGSSGHQHANAGFLERAGAAVVVDQSALDGLGAVVASLIGDRARLDAMARSCGELAKPDAAEVIAAAMIEAAA